MGSSSKSHRTGHAARFSAGSASTQVCAAAQARLCAACAAAVVRRSRQVEITQPEDLGARQDVCREWRCGSGRMGSGHCGHFDETHRTGSTQDGLHADAAHASLATLHRILLLTQTRTSVLLRATCSGESVRGNVTKGEKSERTTNTELPSQTNSNL